MDFVNFVETKLKSSDEAIRKQAEVEMTKKITDYINICMENGVSNVAGAMNATFATLDTYYEPFVDIDVDSGQISYTYSTNDTNTGNVMYHTVPVDSPYSEYIRQELVENICLSSGMDVQLEKIQQINQDIKDAYCSGEMSDAEYYDLCFESQKNDYLISKITALSLENHVKVQLPRREHQSHEETSAMKIDDMVSTFQVDSGKGEIE